MYIFISWLQLASHCIVVVINSSYEGIKTRYIKARLFAIVLVVVRFVTQCGLMLFANALEAADALYEMHRCPTEGGYLSLHVSRDQMKKGWSDDKLLSVLCDESDQGNEEEEKEETLEKMMQKPITCVLKRGMNVCHHFALYKLHKLMFICDQ